MTFTTPAHISKALTDRIRTRLLTQAFHQAEAAQALIGKDEHDVEVRRFNGALVALVDSGRHYGGKIIAANIEFRPIHRITEDSVKNATDLLEDRVSRNLAETDKINKIELSIGNEDLIEGTVFGATAEGKLFTIAIQMLWNYRYGENSANGVLTVYPQFRGSRNGEPMEGEAQKSKATAEKEAAKAEREAAKAARRVELRAKFAKAPERLAREMEKDLKDWRDDHPTAPQWAFIRDAARALTVEQLDEMFKQGARTSGDIESRLERQFRAMAIAA